MDSDHRVKARSTLVIRDSQRLLSSFTSQIFHSAVCEAKVVTLYLGQKAILLINVAHKDTVFG